MDSEDNAASCYFSFLKKNSPGDILECAQEPILRIAATCMSFIKVLGGTIRKKMALTEPLRAAIENMWESSPNI